MKNIISNNVFLIKHLFLKDAVCYVDTKNHKAEQFFNEEKVFFNALLSVEVEELEDILLIVCKIPKWGRKRNSFIAALDRMYKVLPLYNSNYVNNCETILKGWR